MKDDPTFEKKMLLVSMPLKALMRLLDSPSANITT